jgi:hypothetical protein
MKQSPIRARRTWLVLAALIVTVVVASAQSPHFVGRVTAVFQSGNTGAVVVSWKEAGLGNNQLITYAATADATATYVCVNNGGQCPDAANKLSVQGPVSATGTFSSGDNGQINQSLTLQPPAPTAFCPGGQTEVLAEVSYTNITITDTTNGISQRATPSSLSATLFTCP